MPRTSSAAWLLALCLCPSLSLASDALAQTPDERRTEARERELDGMRAVVRGRCVDGATGEPLAGCVVTAKTWGMRIQQDVPEHLKKPEPVTTGADGTFEIAVLAWAGLQVGLDVACENRWPRTGRWGYLVPGTVEHVGDVELHRGVFARAVVVDEQGAPLPSTMLGIDELTLSLDDNGSGDTDSSDAPNARLRMHTAANRVRWARSDADGALVSREALPPGTFALRSATRELQLVSPRTITIPRFDECPADDGGQDNGGTGDGSTGDGARAMQPIRVVLRQPPYVAGVVVDEAGAPVPGVRLRADLRRDGQMASGFSRDDGSFRIYRIDDCPEEFTIEIMSPGPCERRGPTEAVTWGTHDMRIEMRRALTADLNVRLESGEPLERYSVRCYPLSVRSSEDMNLRHAGEHEHGRLTIDRVPRGPCRLVVVPEDPTLHTATVDFTCDEKMQPLEVRVVRLTPLMVQVLDADGAPLAGVTVKVVEPGTIDRPHGPNNPRMDTMQAFSTDPASRHDSVVHTARTDEGGQCIARGLEDRRDLRLVVYQNGKEVLRVDEVAFGSGAGGRTLQLEPR